MNNTIFLIYLCTSFISSDLKRRLLHVREELPLIVESAADLLAKFDQLGVGSSYQDTRGTSLPASVPIVAVAMVVFLLVPLLAERRDVSEIVVGRDLGISVDHVAKRQESIIRGRGVMPAHSWP